MCARKSTSPTPVPLVQMCIRDRPEAYPAVTQPETPQASVGTKQIALTFDDGPYKNTEKVLDLLDQYNARLLYTSFALLTGTTFAWLTDSVSNKGNKIQSGALKISASLYSQGENGIDITIPGYKMCIRDRCQIIQRGCMIDRRTCKCRAQLQLDITQIFQLLLCKSHLIDIPFSRIQTLAFYDRISSPCLLYTSRSASRCWLGQLSLGLPTAW